MAELFFNLDETFQILMEIFAVCFLIQLFYYLFFFAKICSLKDRTKAKPGVPISVIICARNEADNLEKFLPSVLNQNYPNYEVIVVDDCSEDETDTLLSRLKLEHPHLRTTTLRKDDKFSHGKKLALTVGIKAAKNEWLVFTDADCTPASKDWILTMQGNFTDNTEVVLGYGGYIHRKGLLNNIIRFDTFFIALQFLSSSLAGWPYMGTGRNMAYRRSLFFKHKGFASHAHLLSGDDDLFIKQVATRRNTTVEINSLSHTRSEAKTTWKGWFRQKRRHLTTWNYYRTRTNIFIGMEATSRMFFYFSFIFLLIFYSDYIIWFTAFFIVRLILQITIFKIAMKYLCERYLLLSSFVFDIFMPLINLGLVVTNFFSSKRNTWN